MALSPQWKGLIVDRNSTRSGLDRSTKRSSEFGGSRWIAVCLAFLVAFAPVVYGHANATVAQHGAQWAVEHNHGFLVKQRDGHQAPCNDAGKASHQGTCCISTSSCSFCATVDGHLFTSVSGSQPVATAPHFMSYPGEVQLRLRHPKLIVTA